MRICIQEQDQGDQNFEHFLLYFGKRFNCRFHVLRTDGGKEYVNVDPFCKSASVKRQVSESENQDSMEKLNGCTGRYSAWQDAFCLRLASLHRSKIVDGYDP